MLLFLQLFACEEGTKTFMYDISSHDFGHR